MKRKGHNKPPRRKTFRRAWADAILSDAEIPTGAVAVAWKMVHEMDRDGCGIAASDAALMVASGLSERGLRNCKKWLTDAGYIRIHARGRRTGPTIYQGLLPAPDAANNGQHDRHQMPVNELPAPDAGDRVLPAPDAAPRAGNKSPHIEERARVSNNININNNNNPPLSPLPFDDPYDRVKMENGQLALANGCKAKALEMFDGDEKRLDLALTQALGFVQPNCRKPLEAQVMAQLARIVGEKQDRDQRYEKAAKSNSKQKISNKNSPFYQGPR